MMYLPIVFATEAEDNIGEEVHASFMYRFDPVSAQPAFHLYFHVYTSLAVSHRFQFVLPSKALASQSAKSISSYRRRYKTRRPCG